MSDGRMLVNIVTGAEPRELHRFGDFADKPTRYERTGEFMDVMRSAWGAEPVDHSGPHYTVEGATTRAQPVVIPEMYFGGASDDAKRVAAKSADVFLVWGEPPQAAKKQADDVRALASKLGRELRYGIRFHVIARPTSQEAWAAADALLSGISADAIAQAQADFDQTMSEGQRRMAKLHSDPNASLEIYPNLWAGIGLVRGGAGTALVGSFEEIAERLVDYHHHGFEEFILSGYPHLEEANWMGEGVMPLLRQRGLIPNHSQNNDQVFSFR